MSNTEERSAGADARNAAPPVGLAVEPGNALQAQIQQAFQPALAEFREQMAGAVRRELDRALQRDGRQPDRGAEGASDQENDDAQRLRPVAEQPDDSIRREAAQPQDAGHGRTADSPEQRGIQAALPGLGKPLLGTIPQNVEHQGEQWLQSRLDAGLDALFSEGVRTAVQQRADQALRSLLRVMRESAPDGPGCRDVRERAEQAVGRLVREALDRVFAGSVRAGLQASGERIIRALVQRDLVAGRRAGQQGLQSLLQGVLAALREHWQHLLQVLLQAIAAVAQARLSSALRGAFGASATAPAQRAGG